MFTQKDTDQKIKEYLNNGAIIIDVRTDEEWNEDHIEISKHIVLQTIPDQLEQINSWNKQIITVCKSGGRSEQAAQFLKNNGLDAINGGPWQNVAKFVD